MGCLGTEKLWDNGMENGFNELSLSRVKGLDRYLNFLILSPIFLLKLSRESNDIFFGLKMEIVMDFDLFS